jgi:hypothetical protein
VVTFFLGVFSALAVLPAVASTWDVAILAVLVVMLATLVLGIVSLRRIRARRLKGKGSAIAGMVLIVVVFLGSILIILPAT